MPRLKMLNQVCRCGHWREEHDGPCDAPECTCAAFEYDHNETGPRLAEYLWTRYERWYDEHPVPAWAPKTAVS